MAERRKHHKVAGLPAAVVAEVNRLLTTPGTTYADVVARLAERGYAVSHSAVGRYGKDFAAVLTRLRQTREQVKAVIAEAGDRPLTELADASLQLAMDKIARHLLTAADIDQVKHKDLLQGLAALVRSTSNLEALKLRARKELAGDLDKALAKTELSEAEKDRIRQEIYGG